MPLCEPESRRRDAQSSGIVDGGTVCGRFATRFSRVSQPGPAPQDRIGFTPRTVLSTEQARAGGWTNSAIRNALATGRWVRLRVGCYLVTSTEPQSFTATATAAQEAVRSSVVSHGAAAR